MFTIKTQLTLLFFFSSILAIKAQTKTVYYGSPETGGAEIHLSNDNSYDIVLKHGNYDKLKNEDKEYVYLYDLDLQQNGFKVTEDYTTAKTDSITIHFMLKNIILEKEDIYIGYKLKQENKFSYVNACYEGLLFNTSQVEPYGRNLRVKIPRTEELQLVLKSGKFYIDQFKLSQNANNIYVDYRYLKNKRGDHSKLFVVEINSEKKLMINDRLFSTENPPANYVKRVLSDSISNWEIPILVEQEAYKKFNNPKLNYQPITTISPSNRTNEFAEFESLNEAILTLKGQESKVLLIFKSLLGNNDIHDFYYVFDKIHSNASLDYLSDYHFDKYLLYFAKPEDLNGLKKYTSESINEVIGLNSDLEVVYKENISAKGFYGKYNSMDKKLSQNILAANALSSFKKKCDAKTLTANDFLELGKWRENDLVKKAIEANNDDLLIEESVIFDETEEEEDIKFNTKIDFYYPTINAVEIKEGLHSILEQHKSDQTIDLNFAKLAFDFISYYSFFEEISGISAGYDPGKEHYQFCLYLSRFSVETSTIQNEHTKHIEDHYFTILDILKKEGTKVKYANIVTPAFENILEKENYRLYLIFYYYDYLLALGKQPFEGFNLFFKEIIVQPNNYLEQLKAYYDNHYEYCPNMDALEYYLSTTSNSFAWEVVTKQDKDKALLNKALEWSKASLDIQPDNYYYIDTYAHLEYFLGNKIKAIDLESKAIIQAIENEDKILPELKKTLEKMKNGTLKY